MERKQSSVTVFSCHRITHDYLCRGWQTFPMKGHRVNIFKFVGHTVSVTTTHSATIPQKEPHNIKRNELAVFQ